MNIFQTKLENAFSDYKRNVFSSRKNTNVISFISWDKCFRVRYFIAPYWGIQTPFVKKMIIEAEADWLYKIGYKSREDQGAILESYIRFETERPKQIISVWNSDNDGSHDLDRLSEVVPRMTNFVKSSLLRNNLTVDSRFHQYRAELSSVWDKMCTVIG